MQQFNDPVAKAIQSPDYLSTGYSAANAPPPVSVASPSSGLGQISSALGAAAGPATMANPVLGGALAGASAITSIIGMVLDYNAGVKAQKEAKAMYKEETARAEERNRFYEEQTLAGAKEARRQERFGERQAVAGNVTGISKNAIDQVANLLNSNQSLKANVLKSWGM